MLASKSPRLADWMDTLDIVLINQTLEGRHGHQSRDFYARPHFPLGPTPDNEMNTTLAGNKV